MWSLLKTLISKRGEKPLLLNGGISGENGMGGLANSGENLNRRFGDRYVEK